jgi:two-component system NtrC family response regulator
MVAEGLFRSDLLFRLRTFHLELPPLRRCKADIRGLVLHYIDHLCRHHDLENKGFVPEFMDALVAYDWPGNVRELISTLQKAILANRETPTLFPQHLPRSIRLSQIQSSLGDKRQSAPDAPAAAPPQHSERLSLAVRFGDPPPTLKQVRDRVTEQLEDAYLRRLLALAQNDLDAVGKLSGLSKPRIYALLKKYNISRS